MSILRRFTLILFGLLFITLITVALLVPQALLSIAASVDQIATPVRLLAVIAIDVVILLLVYALIRRRRVVNKGGLSVKSRGGNVLADVSTDSARERMLKAIRDVPDVVSAEAKLDAIDGKADIDMDVVVHGEQTNVPEKHAEIDRALRQVLIKQLGLQLASRPHVHIRLLEHDEVIPEPEPVIEPVVPVMPVIPAPVTPPPAPPAPMTPLNDDTPVGDDEVTSVYGLIGRRTTQMRPAVVEPEAPVAEPVHAEPAVPPPPPEPAMETFTSWRDATSVESAPADTEFTSRHDDWTDESEPIAANEADDDAFYATLRSMPNADITPPPAPEPEINPIAAELQSLDEAAESVEAKGNVMVFNMPGPSTEESTLIMETPHAPATGETALEDSTSAPQSGLYDDNNGAGPDGGEDETDNGSKPL